MRATLATRPELLDQLRELTDATSMDDLLWCMHCETTFPARDIEVQGTYLSCPVDSCDGNPIDWHTYAWLRRQHQGRPGADYYPENPGAYERYDLSPPEEA